MHNSFTLSFTISSSSEFSLFSIASQINSTTSFASSFLKPLVVMAGVPIRIPEVTNGDSGSLGIEFLLTVIFTDPYSSSTSLPVTFLFLKSIKIPSVTGLMSDSSTL